MIRFVVATLWILILAGCDTGGAPVPPTVTPTPTSTTAPTAASTATTIPHTQAPLPDTATPVPAATETATPLPTDTPNPVPPTEMPTPAPPTAMPVPPTETPELPTPTPQVTSGGLGLNKIEWEQMHSEADLVRAMSVYEKLPFRGRGDEWIYGVYFWDGGWRQGKESTPEEKTIEYIRYTVPEDKGIPMEQARNRARQLIPSDAKLIRTSGDTWVTEIYHSDWLIARYIPWRGTTDGGLRGTDPWYGEPPGTLSVDYFGGKMITAMHFNLGTPEARK